MSATAVQKVTEAAPFKSVLEEIEAYPDRFKDEYRNLVVDVADRKIPFGDEVTRRVSLAGRSMEQFKADIATYQRRQAAFRFREDADAMKEEIEKANQKVRTKTEDLRKFDEKVKAQRNKLQWAMAEALMEARGLEDKQRDAKTNFWQVMEGTSLPTYREQMERLHRDRETLQGFLNQTQELINLEPSLVIDGIPHREKIIEENIKRKFAVRKQELLDAISEIDRKLKAIEEESQRAENFKLAD